MILPTGFPSLPEMRGVLIGRSTVLATVIAVLLGCAPSSAGAACNLAARQSPGGHGPLSLSAPDAVLDGTDLVALSAAGPRPLDSHIRGIYSAEQGGAVLRLTITPEKGGTWVVERRHKEPGSKPHTVRYRVEPCGQVLVSGRNDLVVRGAERGVLVLELASGVDSIGADYWIHYVRQP